MYTRFFKDKNILLLVVLFLPVITFANERYYFSRFSLEDGLSQLTITCSYQDEEGFLWFGTRTGLNRFDGYNFKVFLNDPGNPESISDNHILCLAGEGGQYLWIGTNYGLNRFDLSTYTFKSYLHNSEDDSSLSNNMVNSIVIDETGNVWIATANALNRYDPETDSFQRINLDGMFTGNSINALTYQDDEIFIGTTHLGLVHLSTDTYRYNIYSHNPEDPASISHNNVKAIHIDKNNCTWIGTDGGLNYRNAGEETFNTINSENGLSNNNIRRITESPEGLLLVGTFNGLEVIDLDTKEITDHYNTYNTNQGDLSHYSIYSILFDRNQTLWVGTYAGGLNYHTPYKRHFRQHFPGAQLREILGLIGPAVEYPPYLYFATEGGGLLEFHTGNNTFRNYKLTGPSQNIHAHNILKSLYLDGDNILCGTNVGTIYSFDLKKKQFKLVEQFQHRSSIYVIKRDSDGHLLVGGVNQIGFQRIDSKGNRRNEFPLRGKENVTFKNIRALLEIEKGIYLIGTRSGGLYRYDMNNEIMMQYRYSLGKKTEQGIPENYITYLEKDKKGNIWVGTFGGGISLFDPVKGTFLTFDTRHGLLNNSVCAIINTEDGHLWISTIGGISDFDPETFTFKNYTHSDGITVNELSPHAGLLTSEGKIVFSGSNGFIMFNPSQLPVNPHPPSVIIDDLRVNNETFRFMKDAKTEKSRISWDNRITLRHNQSNLTIEYTALNYILSNKNEYKYMLEGFDKEWNEVGARRSAYYTNIPPGKYTFKVKGSNNDGVWNETATELFITILPPVWKSWWAYVVYSLIALSLCILIIRYFREKQHLKNDIRLKQMEVKTREELHQERNKLFTNFSHELRTPLTLIISPLEDILENENLPVKLRERLALVRSNSKRLLRLVNNLMDFQKKENSKLQVNAAEGNIIRFTEEMIVLFRELAITRNIRFNFHPSSEKTDIWFDRNLMEKVFFNFLSNAFKNTPDGGNVDIRLQTLYSHELSRHYLGKINLPADPEETYLVVEIEDSGYGIPKEDLENIFIPFYQVSQNQHAASGTGLGLSLSKSIIEMHHGTVWADSPEGKGAVITFILPTTNTHFSESELVRDYKDSEDTQHYTVELPVEKIIRNSNKENKYTILVVEDNVDVRYYIMSHLVDNFNVIEAPNGIEALEKAIHFLPDLVITDLMMPKMNGIELCVKIKNDIRTSHIPVLMITARTTVQDIREGYESGADEYITKPFNASLLRTRVNNILKTREQLKEIYGKRFSLESLGVETTSLDEKFMQKLYDIMEKNISNPEFKLDDFCREIGMSRANLYRKIKAVTNYSPNEFIRNFRLEVAAKMLKETDITVSQVFVATGFNSHAYFSNCFKSLYGLSPTEYKTRETASKQESVNVNE